MSRQPVTSEIDPADEELVAYLDGELEAADRQQVERRLADDADYRSRLRLLQRTWDALDVLGRTDPDEGFTRTTVELVAVKAAEEVRHEHWRLVRRRNWKWLLWTLAAGISAAAGWLALTLVLTQPDRELKRDFFVIERVDEYRNAESFEFIQALDESGLFASEPEGELATASGGAKTKLSEDAASRIKNLKPEEKARLIQKNERFTALSPQEQDHLRRLHQQIAAAPSAARLSAVLDRYSRWLKTLLPAQQSELMGLPIEERLAKIRAIQQQQIHAQFWDLAWQLEKDDLETIYAWMQEFAADHQSEILKQGDPGWQVRVLSADANSRRRMLVGAVFGMRRQREREVLPSDADFQVLARRVSPTLQFQLSQQKSDEDRRKLLLTCAQFAWMSQWAPPPPKDEELSRFYAELDSVQRDRVERLEPQQMKRELIRLYHEKRLRDGSWRWGSGSSRSSQGGRGPSRDGADRSRSDGPNGSKGDGEEGSSEGDKRQSGQGAQEKGGSADAEPPEKKP